MGSKFILPYHIWMNMDKFFFEGGREVTTGQKSKTTEPDDVYYMIGDLLFVY